jgi:hypothetical protein
MKEDRVWGTVKEDWALGTVKEDWAWGTVMQDRVCKPQAVRVKSAQEGALQSCKELQRRAFQHI